MPPSALARKGCAAALVVGLLSVAALPVSAAAYHEDRTSLTFWGDQGQFIVTNGKPQALWVHYSGVPSPPVEVQYATFLCPPPEDRPDACTSTVNAAIPAAAGCACLRSRY